MANHDEDQIRAQCSHFLCYHYPQSPREALAELARVTGPEVTRDSYGKGDLIADFEKLMAAILGKPAAVFMPSGTMAQQIALRIWADRKGIRNVAFHPTCHLETYEEQAYRELHHLNGVLVGNRHQLMTLDDLNNIKVPLSTLLIELPQREIGGALPTWEDLNAIIAWARERGITTHMDGARLWECKPYYRRDYAKIAALFDTVYVSLYKIVDGISGALLAGPEDVIAEARVWQRRHGGNLPRMYPFVLSAKRGLAYHLRMIGAYHAKAVEIADALRSVPGIEITPDPPHTNMMHVFIKGSHERLWEASVEIAQEKKIWLLPWLKPSQIPSYQMTELAMGSASLDLKGDEVAGLFQELMKRAHAVRVG